MFKQEYTIRLWLIRNVMTAFVGAGFFGVTMELLKMIGGTMDFTLTTALLVLSMVVTIFVRIIIIHDYVPMVRNYERNQKMNRFGEGEYALFMRRMNKIKDLSDQCLKTANGGRKLPIKENIVVPYATMLTIWDTADQVSHETPVEDFP